VNPAATRHDRNCKTREGVPKKPFASFDEAMAALASMDARGMNAYRCDEHGWHIGHGAPVIAR
jgi:hypothetical protein